MKNNNGIFLFTLAILLLAGMVFMTVVQINALPKKPVDKPGQLRYNDRNETRKWLI